MISKPRVEPSSQIRMVAPAAPRRRIAEHVDATEVGGRLEILRIAVEGSGSTRVETVEADAAAPIASAARDRGGAAGRSRAQARERSQSLTYVPCDLVQEGRERAGRSRQTGGRAGGSRRVRRGVAEHRRADALDPSALGVRLRDKPGSGGAELEAPHSGRRGTSGPACGSIASNGSCR